MFEMSRSACDHTGIQELVSTEIGPKDCDHNPGELELWTQKDPDVSTGGPNISNIVLQFRLLQPAEQKRILDILQDELNKTGFECTYCGRRIRNPIWLANLPLCRSCHSRLFSPIEKRRMVYGGR